MENGRLIRVTKHGGDLKPVAYIVAIADSDAACDLIRIKIAAPEDEVRDLGRVSDVLVRALKLLPGQYIRTDQMSESPPNVTGALCGRGSGGIHSVD